MAVVLVLALAECRIGELFLLGRQAIVKRLECVDELFHIVSHVLGDRCTAFIY